MYIGVLLKVYSGMDVNFEGQTITAEPSVSSTFTFQAQTSEDISKSPTHGSDDSQTTTIVVVIVICAVILIAIVVFVIVSIYTCTHDYNVFMASSHF